MRVELWFERKLPYSLAQPKVNTAREAFIRTEQYRYLRDRQIDYEITKNNQPLDFLVSYAQKVVLVECSEEDFVWMKMKGWWVNLDGEEPPFPKAEMPIIRFLTPTAPTHKWEDSMFAFPPGEGKSTFRVLKSREAKKADSFE